jgi:hypothetical protein
LSLFAVETCKSVSPFFSFFTFTSSFRYFFIDLRLLVTRFFTNIFGFPLPTHVQTSQFWTWYAL